MASRPLFVAIAGNIGSGKSSLTQLLSEHFKWKPYFESVEDNPYISDFYSDMSRWSYHLQIYFLANRFKYYKEIIKSSESVIQDRSIYEDAEIFARNLHDIGKMTERDYANYILLFHEMSENIKPPDLMIYLQANVDTLMKNISKRGQNFEHGIQRLYIEQLNSLYDDWIARYKLGPLLVIESDDLDFINNPVDLNYVLARVKYRLPQMMLFE